MTQISHQIEKKFSPSLSLGQLKIPPVYDYAHLREIQEKQLMMRQVETRQKQLIFVAFRHRPISVKRRLKAPVVGDILSCVCVKRAINRKTLTRRCISASRAHISVRENNYLITLPNVCRPFTCRPCTSYALYCSTKHSVLLLNFSIVASFHHWFRFPCISYSRPIVQIRYILLEKI